MTTPTTTPPDLAGLKAFVRESNRIEGITRSPLLREMGAHERFLRLPSMSAQEMSSFVRAVAPGHVLRTRVGVNVRVGNHIAPPGGPDILERLMAICGQANESGDPYETHRAYETLHPFTDGNGRSGRALWLWMMLRQGRDPYALRRGFLHSWYYQSLSAARP